MLINTVYSRTGRAIKEEEGLESSVIGLTLNPFYLATPLSSPSIYHVLHLLINRKTQKTVWFEEVLKK